MSNARRESDGCEKGADVSSYLSYIELEEPGAVMGWVRALHCARLSWIELCWESGYKHREYC